MQANKPYQISKKDIRLILLESWVLGEVADSVQTSHIDVWLEAARELAYDLEIPLDPPYKDTITGLVHLRANHGFPLEMHWDSPEANHWLHDIPERIHIKEMWDDIFYIQSLLIEG